MDDFSVAHKLDNWLDFSAFPCTASVNYLQHLCRFIRVCEWFTAEPEAPCGNTLSLFFFSSHCFPFCRSPPLEQLLYDSLSLIVGTKQQALSGSFILSAWLFLVLSIFRPPLWELASLSEKLAVHNLKTSPLITCDICLWYPWCCLRQDWHPFYSVACHVRRPGPSAWWPSGLPWHVPLSQGPCLSADPPPCPLYWWFPGFRVDHANTFLPIMLQHTSVS